MTARLPRLVTFCAFALLVVRPSMGLADDVNFRPYVVGGRAAGMGGAFTALADDGSGSFYNPGGLAFVRRSQLSLSGSVYGLVTGSYANALGDGHDFNYSNLNTFPTTTAGVWKLGGGEGVGGSESSDTADVLSFGVFVPDALNVDGRATVVQNQNAFFFAQQIQTVWAGFTYAKRIGRLGIGVSGFGLFGTRIDHVDLTVVDAANASRFGTISGRVDESTYGVVGAVGVRWDATDDLHLGLSVYSPELGMGSRKVFARVAAGAGVVSATSPSEIAVVNVEGLDASPTLPLRAQAGIAWTSGPLTLSADVIAIAGRRVHDNENRAAEGLDRLIVRKAVVNGAVGLEYVIADHFPIRAGFYTDFSASNPPDPTSNVQNSSHVDRYAGTAAVGYRTEHTATTIGVNVTGGSGTDVVPDNLDFQTYKLSKSTQFLTYVFIGTSYEF